MMEIVETPVDACTPPFTCYWRTMAKNTFSYLSDFTFCYVIPSINMNILTLTKSALN